LKGFEHIKGVILDPLPFDMERDLVTATLKKKRNNMAKYYKVPNIFAHSLPLSNS
jgi:long-chain acyl-CoA synthetase